MVYKLVKWPDAKGKWWLVAETGADGSYTPMLELNPQGKGKHGMLEPTYENQQYLAAKLLVDAGMEALYSPHAATGAQCGCGDCYCCAALKVWRLARRVEGDSLRPRDEGGAQ